MSNAVPGFGRSMTRKPECTVFVGGISHQTTIDELRTFFFQFGKVRKVQ